MSSDRPPSPAARNASREPATVRIAMWSARHRWPVVVLWFVADDRALRARAPDGRDRRLDANGNPNERQLEASEAYDVFSAGGTNDPSSGSSSSSTAGPGAATDPAFQAAVGDLVAAPRRRQGRRRRRRDRRPSTSSSTRSRPRPRPGSISRRRDDRPDHRHDPRRGRPGPEAPRAGPRRSSTRPARPTPTDDPRHQPHVHQRRHQRADLARPGQLARASRIPLTFIILLFAFGAIVASVVPLVLAITSLIAAFGILGIYSQLVGPVSPNATQLIVLIGLAVAVDYSLFMITRFRVERRAGRRSRRRSRSRAARPAGRSSSPGSP